MGCLSDASRACSALILLAINCVLLAGGALVLYGSLHAQNSGWVDVVASYWGGAHTILTVLTVVGGVIIALAVLGSIAACCRWRLGLLVYAWLVAIVLLAFIVVAVFAFMVRGKAVDWKAMAYPATTDETSLKTEFDRAYCFAQGAYICNEMGMAEAAQIFYPSYANSSLTGLFTNLKGVNAICDVLLPSVPSLQSVCKGCAAAKQFANFTSVLDWANDKCPRTSTTLLWCGTFLGQSNSGADIAVGTAPYSQCRPAFLDLIKGWATTLGVGSLVVCGGAFLVVVFACVLRRRERQEQRYEQTASGSAPQTNAPYYGHQQPAGQGYDQRYGKV